MKAFTLPQAFKALREAKDYVPFEEIKYLYETPDTPELQERLTEELFFAEDNSAIWMNVVAENHLNEKLVDALLQQIINTSEEENLTLTIEQLYLFEALGKQFPDYTAETLLDAWNMEIREGTYHGLSTSVAAFNSIDLSPYKDQLIEIMNHENCYFCVELMELLARGNVQEIRPRAQELYTYCMLSYDKSLDEGDNDAKETFAEILQMLDHWKPSVREKTYYHYRMDWLGFLEGIEMELETEITSKEIEDLLKNEFGVEDIVINPENYSMHSQMPRHVEHTGRNDPCPCGSGIKYKKCCGK